MAHLHVILLCMLVHVMCWSHDCCRSVLMDLFMKMYGMAITETTYDATIAELW